jgi:GT2 family glycosyltransferase
MSEVAILIPSMDNRAYLEPCLTSLRDNTCGVTHEVYVINNGAPDSCDWIDKNDINVCQVGMNAGWERSLCLGIEISEEPFILFLNDDTLFLRSQRNWLGRLVADLDDPNVAAAGPSSNMVAGAQSTAQSLSAPRYEARYLIGFCLLARRSALNEVGGVDTALPGGDDIDLSIRLRQAGYTLVCDRRSFVYHFGFKTGRRVYGDRTVPGGWNSPQMIEKTANALIAKHGQAAFADAWRQDPLGEYHALV